MSESFVWDSDPVAFHVPFINWPVAWYGILFVFGLSLSYFMIFKKILTSFESKQIPNAKQEALKFSDNILWFLMIGIILGARLGHLIFYERSFTFIEIFKTWEGGLASHGGAVGLLLALFIFSYKNRDKYQEAKFLPLLDLLVIPTCFTGTCIRIGNFINQEILGTAYNGPFSVLFLHPLDGSAVIPRHPAQLYEAFFYLLLGLAFLIQSKIAEKKPDGFKAGMLLVCIFVFRFFIEFIKEEQSLWNLGSLSVNMGQLLSLPIILLGLSLIILAKYQAKKAA